jgi:hypothetical protein
MHYSLDHHHQLSPHPDNIFKQIFTTSNNFSPANKTSPAKQKAANLNKKEQQQP